MGIVWEAYHKGVPLLGVPGITPEKTCAVMQLLVIARITKIGLLQQLRCTGCQGFGDGKPHMKPEFEVSACFTEVFPGICAL